MYDDSLPVPGSHLNVEEKGKLLLSYLSARRPVRGLDFSTAALRNTDLRGADLSGATLTGANLFGADLRGAILSGAQLSRANLQGAKLNDADLRNTRLHSAQLEGAVLAGADLRFAELNQARAQLAVLQGANLASASLNGANLQRARMRSATLRGADLRGVDLKWADLLMADVTGAHIDAVGIRRSALSPATLADLRNRGLTVSEDAPDRAPISTEGLWLRGEFDGVSRAGLALALAAWREGKAGREASLAEDDEVVITADVDELEAVAAVLTSGDFAALGDLTTLATPALLTRLATALAGREGMELWLRKRGGLSKVDDY
ncbi:MAG: hypothetical protein ACI8RZ_000062 [Myxococcota bacterium]